MKIYLDKGAYKPEKAHNVDAGFDLRTPRQIIVKAHDSETVDTGVHVEIPVGYVGMIKSKSGLNVNDGIVTEGVIDTGYRGSIRVKFYNHSDVDKVFNPGNKITQLVIMPIALFELEEVASLDEFEDSDRGSNGFGSTGV